MEEKDLKQIKEVVKEELKPLATKEDVKTAVSAGLAEFWEGNLEPALEEINENQSIMQTKLDKALYKETERITKLEKDMKIVKEKLGIAQ